VRHLLEGAVALVHVEQVRGVEPADVDVQPAAVVDVDEGRPLLPDPGRGALVSRPPPARSRPRTCPAAEVAEQPAALRLADHEQVRPSPSSVEVPDRDPGADRPGLELARTGPRAHIRGSAYLFSVLTPVASAGFSTNIVAPRGKGRGESALLVMEPAVSAAHASDAASRLRALARSNVARRVRVSVIGGLRSQEAWGGESRGALTERRG
jgi:hypothetical protein